MARRCAERRNDRAKVLRPEISGATAAPKFSGLRFSARSPSC